MATQILNRQPQNYNSGETSPIDEVLSELASLLAGVDISTSQRGRPQIGNSEEEEGYETGACGIADYMQSVGVASNMQPETSPVLKLKKEWLDSCLALPEFSRLEHTDKVKFCFEKFLHSDMNSYGGGVLPHNVGSKGCCVTLPGPFVLQVDGIVEISWPSHLRFGSGILNTSLQLSMTDGVQRVVGREIIKIKDLRLSSPAGLKIFVSDVQISNGVFLLTPKSVKVLGGMVEELEEARKNALEESNDSRRKRSLVDVDAGEERIPQVQNVQQRVWPDMKDWVDRIIAQSGVTREEAVSCLENSMWDFDAGMGEACYRSAMKTSLPQEASMRERSTMAARHWQLVHLEMQVPSQPQIQASHGSSSSSVSAGPTETESSQKEAGEKSASVATPGIAWSQVEPVETNLAAEVVNMEIQS